MNKTGIELIAEERKRQMEGEGWTAEMDGQQNSGQLARAAISYIIYGLGQDEEGESFEGWPWRVESWKPKDHIRNLIRAGAMIAAEIDRLQRLDPNQ